MIEGDGKSSTNGVADRQHTFVDAASRFLFEKSFLHFVRHNL